MATKVGTPQDYEQQYAEDPPDAECSPNARVWRVYSDEARALDAVMVGNLRENADVLLVFAGLFSAVVSTFVAQTSQSLQRDYNPVTATLTYELVQLQRALLNGSDGASVAASSWTPDNSFSPSATDVWVNGLWFISLTLSLITSLIAVLAKQWLSHYASAPLATSMPRDQARIRHFCYANFQAWRIPVIVGVLPFLLHVALAMFLAGLVIYLSTLVHSLEYIIGATTSITFLAYAITLAASVINPACPYRTPLTTILDIFQRRFISWWLRFGRTTSIRHLFPPAFPLEADENRRTLGERERDMIGTLANQLDPEILLWLIRPSSSLSVHNIAMQAMGGVSTVIEPYIATGLSGEEHAWQSHQALLEHSLDLVKDGFYEPKEGHEQRVIRLLHVRRRFAPEHVKRAEEPFTCRLLPRSWFDNVKVEPSTLIAIYLLERRQHIPMTRPYQWPSLSSVLLSVMDRGVLPLHVWKAVFEQVDISAMCKLSWEHNSNAEAFCAAYIGNRSEPFAQPVADFETRVLKFSDVIAHFQTSIDDYYIFHFTRAFWQPPVALQRELPESSGFVSTHQLLWGIFGFLLTCRRTSRAPSDSILAATPHSPQSPYCLTCGRLFLSALGSVERILHADPPRLAESKALEAVMSRIISSQLFAEQGDFLIQGDENDFGLWEIRSRVIRAYAFMTGDPQRVRGHLWRSSADSFVTFMRITFSGAILTLNETPSDLQSQDMLRLRCVSRMSMGLQSYWPQSSIDATYAAFRELDVLKFIDHLTLLDLPLFALVDGYIGGLLRAVNAQDTAAVAPHVEYLCQPDRLFTALFIAMLGKNVGLRYISAEKVTNLLIKIIKLCRTSTAAPEDPLWTAVLLRLEEFHTDDKGDHYFFKDNKMVRTAPVDRQFFRDKVEERTFWLRDYLVQQQTGEGSIVEVDVANSQDNPQRSMPLNTHGTVSTYQPPAAHP